MTNQPQAEALRLADYLLQAVAPEHPESNGIEKAAAELRRLFADNELLRVERATRMQQNDLMAERIAELEATAQSAREPLAEGKLRDLWAQYSPYIGAPFDFARAIESAHGIQGGSNGN